MNHVMYMIEAPSLTRRSCRRVTITNVTPLIDGGSHPIKRVLGEAVVVEADIFVDGHASLAAVLKYRSDEDSPWQEVPMQSLGNDRWQGSFVVNELGCYWYTIEAWVDRFKTWRHDLEAKIGAGQDVSVEIQAGVHLIEAVARKAASLDAERLRELANELRTGESLSGSTLVNCALDAGLADLMGRHPDRQPATTYGVNLEVVVDPVRAQFSVWYEMFPRSCAPDSTRHGTFKDCLAQLPRIAGMGFDVLYLPPVHPIGKSFRKGRNNQTACELDDPGSPWAIGSIDGGHKSIHPQLGTLDDFRELIRCAGEFGLEVALDIAFQCSPDHPYVREHPHWFVHRPDGSIQYAENPPKKYQDIYPLNFECEDWQGLWRELKSVFEFWIRQGVRIFRVDNPHTKTFSFWEWCLKELKQVHPELIFLAEAFTRPKLLYELAKVGFTQSYNYFPWRNSKDELESYFAELTHTPVADFMRPNLWPNTPDILPHFLQTDNPAAFAIRLVLAATLGASYGIYGPAFELCEHTPREPGAEEYLNSEKYEIKHWDLGRPSPLGPLITTVNKIRRENLPLQANRNLRFHHTDNDRLIAYSKSTDDGSATILTVVNLSPEHTHSGWLDLPLTEFQISPGQPFQMHDLLSDTTYVWHGPRNYIALNPAIAVAHIFRLRRLVRAENGIDYFE